jgi:hypothetical protein
MTTATINMKLDADTASIFTKAPAEDRNKLCVLWSVLLREYKAAPVPLSKLMDQIGAKAKARGLNADKLESILDAE